jgi:RHS repeat-associated protein
MLTETKNITRHSSLNYGLIFGLVLLIMACAAVTARAQNPKQPQRGFYPAGSYALSDVETINTTNGNVIFRIPLVSLPPGRGGLSAGVGLYYNSKIWETFSYEDGRFEDGSYSTELRASDSGGWRYGFKYNVQLVHRYQENQPAHVNCIFNNPADTYVYKVKMKFPDGSEHVFRPSGYTDSQGDNFFRMRPDGWMATCGQPDSHVVSTGMTYYSADGTFMRLTFGPDGDNDPSNNPWLLSLSDGSHVTGGNGPQRVFDRNNNYIEIRNITYNNHPASEIVDQLGRHIVVEYGPAVAPYPEVGRDYVHAWRTENGQLTELIWTIKWRGISVSHGYYMNPNDVNIGSATFGPGTIGVSEIDLPTQAGGLAYNFGYNVDAPSGGWGEVSSITLPSGAQVNYKFFYDISSAPESAIMSSDILKDYPYQKDLKYNLEYDRTSTQTTETWQYSVDETSCVITAPDGGITREHFNNTNVDLWDSGLSYKTENPDGSVVERIWQQNIPYGYGSSTPAKANSYLKTEFTSIRNAAGSLVKTATKDYTYDKNGNLTQEADYDWVNFGDVPRGTSGKPTGAIPASAPVKRVTVSSYYSATPSADSAAFDADIYTQYTAPNFRNALESGEVRSDFSDTTALSRTENTYDNPSTTGNLIEQRSWDSTKGALVRPLSSGTYVSVSHQYDVYGNPTLSTDANGNLTQLFYEAVNGVEHLYPTKVITALNTPIQRTSLQEYDFYSGQVTRATDFDNNVSTSTTYDVFGRPILVKAAEGKPEETRTATVYSDMSRRVVVRSDLNAVGDSKLVSIQHYDQLGRVRLSRTLEDSSTQSETDERDGIKVQARYKIDQASHSTYQIASNPYRAETSAAAGGESTMGWAVTTSDQGNRFVRSESFSGASLPAPWGNNSGTTGAVLTSYDAESVTVTDQKGNTRKSVTDGLGRLSQVYEAPDAPGYNYLTSYTYDALGNLTGVAQGVQMRTFQYSSLSRLVSATNPESGTVQYQYDANGNPVLKIDPRQRPGSLTLPNCSIPYIGSQIATCNEYDSLNRVKSRTYNDGTPNVSYTYDASGANSKGRLSSVSSSVSTCSYTTYDALGRVRGSSQLTDGVTYPMPDYKYNLAGALISEQYPSGRIVQTEYDAAGRVAGVKNQATDLYYTGGDPGVVNNPEVISYTASGATLQAKLGNGLWERASFNSRLQPTQLWLGTPTTNTLTLQLDYTYGTDDTHNNGNVRSQTITAPGMSAVAQSYTYDKLNRLSTAQEAGQQGWTQNFSYDQYGNRNFAAGTTYPNYSQTLTDPVGNPVIDPANNRIKVTALGQGNYIYDAAGNLTRTLITSQTYHDLAYDAENRQVKADGGASAGGADYSYDGDGRRVKKVNGTVTTVFIYDISGQLVAEYSNSAPVANGTRYVTSDSLGSPRVITSSDGQVTERHDYMPFGEETATIYGGRGNVQGYGVDQLRQKFASYERDNETGLDFAEARYYSSMQGRFTGPDDFLKDSDPSDPQSWNKYVYVRNNPLKYVDPTGEKADVKIETDEEHHTGTITITASIAIYSQGNSNYTQGQLDQAAKAIDGSIDSAWSGTFKGADGITYTVKTDVDVQVYGSQEEAMKSNAQNVIGISKDDPAPGERAFVNPRVAGSPDSAPDTGVWKFDRVMNGGQAAHEFTHLLGASDFRGRDDVSFSAGFPDYTPVSKYGKATGADFRGVLGGALQEHREGSRSVTYTSPCCPYPGVRVQPIAIYGRERSRTSTKLMRAPYQF